MAFDCYCAICGVGFSGMRVEPTSQTPLDRRRRWIEKRFRALESGEDLDLNSGDEDCVRSYDPRIVDNQNVAWLSKAHCLGMETSGKNKKFVSGPGYYADVGELAVKMGPSQKRAYFSCYGFGTEDAPGPVMPFHWPCFEILLRSLTGSTETRNVNLDALYEVMSDLCNGTFSALDLNYGGDIVRAQGQYWQCIPGAEYCVRHPTEIPSLHELIQTEIRENAKLRLPFTTLSLNGRQPQNPFGRLPVEIIDQICSFLPGDALKALSKASLLIHLLIAQDNLFWKRFLGSEMPWLWELQSTLSPSPSQEPHAPSDLNYKSLYLWLDKFTTPTYGMEDSVLMGAANRRRIWRVCAEQLVPKYCAALGVK